MREGEAVVFRYDVLACVNGGYIRESRIMVDMLVVWWLLVFFQAEDGIRVVAVTGVQTCALPI